MPHTALDPARIVATAQRLCDRIRERFPDAGLADVAASLLAVARSHAQRSAAIRRPNHGLRLVASLLVLFGLGSLGLLLASARADETTSLTQVVQGIEAGLSMTFFVGAAAVYLFTLEVRSRRRRCLEALHELRSIAHIVDLHQLTKDPERVLRAGPDTPASPERPLSRFELARYLDYCSEMLSVTGKLAALYAQGFPDPAAVAAVDDIEDLTNGLSRKIWQKIMILSAAPPGAEGATP